MSGLRRIEGTLISIITKTSVNKKKYFVYLFELEVGASRMQAYYSFTDLKLKVQSLYLNLFKISRV